MIKNKNLYIDGRWQEALSKEVRSIYNPFDKQVLASVAEGGRVDAKKAILSAKSAFNSGEWRNFSAVERGRMVYALGDLIEDNKEELARLETLNTGKTYVESIWDMDDIAGIFRYYGGLADKNEGEGIASPNPNSQSRVIKEPIGVVGMICPWNYPLLQAAWKIAPALAAGCTMVIKPSEFTPLTTLLWTELAEKVGFPKGVINTVLGPGHSIGAELAENPDVDMISFTGGVVTGKKIMKAAAGNVKKVALELGGKNPHILFEDGDWETAIDFILNGVFFHAGQICSAGTRVMVATPIHDQVVKHLEQRIKKIKLGNGMDKETQMGPLISDSQLEKVSNHVENAIAEGAKLIAGGKQPSSPALANGFFYEPTLLVGCTKEMAIVKEEIFGPVIHIEKFDTEEEAVKNANDTIYGLSAGFWTRDAQRMERVSKALRFGTVWVNDFNVYFVQAPWGGYKQSGLGRELGHTGLEEFQEIKHIYQNFNPSPLNWFGN
ncbi:aldehyde dehydrogenase family protein [Cyclobacterium marinum]|uniref:Aldehyde Dehydrogenase n=1 Tax=Cyclobacterium marinum (strain ATCC 25205 / DSM 745 / LMG 13164 / NCIMB 1802) TaxID=880070 RepID=G0J6M1_CYCMS|nr:aldehyde dehydrogenase family protein [Cyclobacterium marinum]AEL28536.1 Aldehyde Dehydrogenase [Cyclobacterium marinum DSM 745]